MQTIIIANGGDLEINAGGVYILIVDSGVLCANSEMLKGLLLGSFLEGISFQKAKMTNSGPPFRLDLSMDNGAALVDMFTLLHNRTSPAPGNISGQRLLDLVVAIDFYDAKDALAHLLQTIVANVNTDDVELSKLHLAVAMRLHDKEFFTRIHSALVRHYNWPTFEAE